MGTVPDLLSWFVMGHGGSEGLRRRGAPQHGRQPPSRVQRSALDGTDRADRGERARARTIPRRMAALRRARADRRRAPGSEAGQRGRARLRATLRPAPRRAARGRGRRARDGGRSRVARGASSRLWAGSLPAARDDEEGARSPRLLRSRRFLLASAPGATRSMELSAVAMRVGPGRGAVVFVDNDARDIYGQRYVDSPEDTLDAALRKVADTVMGAVEEAYGRAAAEAARAAAPRARPARPPSRRLSTPCAARCATRPRARLIRSGPGSSGRAREALGRRPGRDTILLVSARECRIRRWPDDGPAVH
jgi:hypothetical protein